jgi:gluconokinase
MIADVFNKEVHQLETADASAVGAAYLANPKISRKQNSQQIFSPNAQHHLVYEKLYSIFQSLYKKLKPEMDTLLSLANR